MFKLHNRTIAAVFGLLALLASSIACAQTKWDMATALPMGNFHTVNQQKFAAGVKAATGGKLDITVHPSASLFKQPEIKRAVQTNQAQLGELLFGHLSNDNPIFGVDNILFLATTFDQARKLDQAARPYIERLLDVQGLKLLYSVPWPPQGIYSNKPIASVNDMDGLKWRAYSPQTSRLGELVRAQPVNVPVSDLTEALAAGRINSMMTSAASGVDSKVWENLKFFYDVKAGLPKQFVFVNKASFEKLPPDQQKAVLEEAAKAEAAGWAAVAQVTKDTTDELRKHGMTVADPNEKFAAELEGLGKTMTEEWVKTAGPDGKALIDAFRR
jgi:TRAP-type C4-dicarboxylate transport system substrate-binding protein